MTTTELNNVQVQINSDLALFEELLDQVTSSEYRAVVNTRRDGLVDSLFDGGIGTIEQVYEYLHMPAQGIGGYYAAVIGLLGDGGKDQLDSLRSAMNNVARAIGKQADFTPEHAAMRVVNNLDSLLFGFKSEDVAKALPDKYAALKDVWALRLRQSIEQKVGFVKSTDRRTASRAIKRLGYEALVQARNAYFAQKQG